MKELYSISLKEHYLEQSVPKTEDNPSGTITVPYDIRTAMAGCLVHPQLQLTGLQLLERYDVVENIRNEEMDTLLLGDSEYTWLKDAVSTITGFGYADHEMLNRIFNAKKVKVEEKDGGV